MLSSLCNVPIESLNEDCEPTSLLSFGNGNNIRRREEAARQLLSSGVRLEDPYVHGIQAFRSEPEKVDVIGFRSAATKVQRKIPTAPCRILDAPDLTGKIFKVTAVCEKSLSCMRSHHFVCFQTIST
jgi:hypothetical protein